MYRFKPVIIALLASLLLVTTLPAVAKSLQGRVVKVSDGDTISVLDSDRKEHKVRLIGIDAPEKKQAFGTASKKNLSSIIFGRVVTVEYKKRDRYGRILGKVICQEKDVNLEQIRSGLAWHYKQYAKEQSPQDRDAYAGAEDNAKTLEAGLWQDKAPIAPWDFRRGKRKEIAVH